jgi:cytochrome b561
MAAGNGGGGRSYGATARALHWIMVVLILVQFTMGIIMVYGGPEPSIWASLTTALALYDVHKLLGLVLLALVLLRIANRIARGVPPPEPSLAAWQRESSALVHAWMYLLLILVPVLGWIGISLFPAVVIFGSITLPALTSPDEAASKPVFMAHAIAAFALIALVVVHVGAALFHHFIRRDGVLRRMLPGLRPRDE